MAANLIKAGHEGPRSINRNVPQSAGKLVEEGARHAAQSGGRLPG